MNQIELHPRLPQRDLVRFCQDKGLVVCAYSPFGRGAGGGMFGSSVVSAIAAKHKVNESSVLLKWSLDRDVVARLRRSRGPLSSTEICAAGPPQVGHCGTYPSQ